MATWILGDVHGCFRTFRALLRRCDFDERSDRLILVGDLVNGGVDSLQTLRWLESRKTLVESVLGNHDLYLLGRWSGVCSKKKKSDTLDALLDAPDVDRLMEWLRQRPLTLSRPKFRVAHAGLLPAWTWAEASLLAQEIESHLRGPELRAFLRKYYEVRRYKPRQRLSVEGRLLGSLQVLTMIRTCSSKGRIRSNFSGPPEEALPGFRPWYEQAKNWAGSPIFFGHWAAAGFRCLESAVALDSGCVWGNQLTAYRAEDGRVLQQENIEKG